MIFYKQIPVSSEGKAFEIRRKVVGVYDKGKSTVMETQMDLAEKGSDEIYASIIGSAFFVGAGGWGGPAGPKGESFAPPAGKEPDMVHEHQTDAGTAHLYRLNGDYNPLHATPEPGTQMGFGGAIMHGLYSWNSTAHALLKLLGGSDPANLREFAARFASPVKPGDCLVTSIWKTGNKDAEGFEDIRFAVNVKGGKQVLSNGRAKLRVVGQKKVTTSKL
jgi:peroxisomal enoyl-CoA hydratase 2